MSDEAHLSAEQPGPQAAPRLPRPYGDGRRTERDPRAPCTRPQEPVGLSPALPGAKKIAPIRKRADFLACNKARRQPMPGFVLLLRERHDGDSAMRLGITVTKKIGNAVVRNRMKRRFRALARELLPAQGVEGADHVLIGREGGIERDFALLAQELEKALRKIQRQDPKAKVLLRRQEPRGEEAPHHAGFLPVQEHKSGDK
jgi:ribonuclease P protein component